MPDYKNSPLEQTRSIFLTKNKVMRRNGSNGQNLFYGEDWV